MGGNEMTKRQLNDDEKRFAIKNLKIMKEELEYLEKVDLPKIQLVLDTAELVVKKQLQEKEIEKKKIAANIEELTNAIKILKKQLREGVDVIKKTKGGKK